MTKTGKKVCIAVPLSNRSTFTEEEKISLNHLEHFLGSYDKFLVIPESLSIARDGFGTKRFSHKYFGSVAAHTQLMLSMDFYETFADYEFVLIYHLDALVFSDQLDAWCDRGFDFIGAPWIPHPDAPYHGFTGHEGLVGNGGFSLRRVSSFLKVLRSKRYSRHPAEHWDRYYAAAPLWKKALNLHKFFLLFIRALNGVTRETRQLRKNEEYFWVHRGRHFYPDFKIATVEEALPFAFECVPRYCYEKNDNKLPFGCHAWTKYDPEFWAPHLLEPAQKKQ